MSKNASRRTLVLFPFVVGFACPATAAPEARVSEAYGKLPLHFEANRGQTHEDVRFLARGAGYSLFLTPTGAVLTLIKPESLARKRAARGSSRPRGPATRTVLRMTFADANPDPRVTGLEELPGKANYFIGNDPAKWRTDVPTYAKVHYQEVYPGIDLVYYGKQRQLEYDLVVRPGADPSAIALRLTGADKVEVDVQGDLVLHTAAGPIRQQKPFIYQEVGGARKEIPGGYVLKGEQRVGFKIAAHDARRPLVIDPILSYSTYLGGGGADRSHAIAVDAAGNAYVTGGTFSPDFPTTAGAFQTSLGAGTFQAFVTKLNPSGSALVYSTYLGGNGGDESYGIAVDAAGNAYVTGRTFSPDFPTTAGAFQTTYGGEQDAFVTQLDAAGSALVYSTYLGGNRYDEGNSIAVDPAGNAYVGGLTQSFDFPTTAGAFQTRAVGDTNAFVAKLDSAGCTLVYCTYLGGSGNTGGGGLAVDASGNVYVEGATDSIDFPTTTGAFQTTYGGGISDAFVAKLDLAGAALVYSTYLGGSGEDSTFGLAVDADGNAYVTGGTFSSDFPTTMGALQTIHGGGSDDAFVTKLDATGSVLVYSTYLGGSGGDTGLGITVDTAGNAFVTGNTDSSDFPTTATAFQTTYGGGTADAFVTQLDAAGSALVYSTYLGGSGNEWGSAIALDTLPNPNAYVTGFTHSGDFPTTADAFQASSARVSEFVPDAFVAKITDCGGM